MSDVRIAVEDVSFAYGPQTVLENVRLEVRQDDFLAVIGPNGGGKTTLLKLMLGLLRPDRGRVRSAFEGRRGTVGYVPQFATFDRDFPLRVRDVVRMGRLGRRGPFRRWTREDRRIADAQLERFGLAPVARRPIGALSGGQLQRTLIARALASEPEILVLDEPLASIDAGFRDVMLRTLREARERIPVVVVTHDLTPYAGLAGRIACVNRRVHVHSEGGLDGATLEEVYGCPVELIAHGVPHRVLGEHGP